VTRLSRAHLAILDLAVEDWYGLWEIAGHVPDHEPSSATALPREELVRALRELLAGGLVELAVRSGPDSEPHVTDMSSAPDLDQAKLWQVPTVSGPQYLVGATPARERVYREARKPS
jgi:hypothetical protein